MQPAGPDPCKIASPSRSRVRLQSGDGNPAETVAQFALGRWGLNIEKEISRGSTQKPTLRQAGRNPTWAIKPSMAPDMSGAWNFD